MKVLNETGKKQYETPTMELLVITGREVMESEHDNDYVDWGELLGLFPKQGYYDE